VYQTVRGEADTEKLRTLLQAGEVDLITFTSSSTVIKLLEQLGDEAPGLVAKAKIACIGPITAVTCLDNGLRPTIIANNFTMQGLVDAIVEYCRKQ
jgi:uroporphyrinogen III methyltransferase/synthase